MFIFLRLTNHSSSCGVNEGYSSPLLSFCQLNQIRLFNRNIQLLNNIFSNKQNFIELSDLYVALLIQ